MGKFFAMTRRLSNPAHKVLTKNSASSFAAFQAEKERFEKEQMDIIMQAIESHEQTAPMMNASANLQTAIAWQPYNEPAQQEETILQSRIKMITY